MTLVDCLTKSLPGAPRIAAAAGGQIHPLDHHPPPPLVVRHRLVAPAVDQQPGQSDKAFVGAESDRPMDRPVALTIKKTHAIAGRTVRTPVLADAPGRYQTVFCVAKLRLDLSPLRE